MGYVSKIAGTLVAAGALSFSVPASAAVETFASYTQVAQGNTLMWRKTASGGSLFTTSTSTATTPGAVAVNFTYLLNSLSYLGPLAANFSLNLTAPNGNPAQSAFGFLIQPGLSGSFSFTYTGADFTIGSTTYKSGANLLSGTVGGAAIAGGANSSSGAASGSTSEGDPISFSSDILSFKNGSDFDFALSLTQINQVLNRPNAASSLRNFRAASTGSFSSDPKPTVIALPVPESATWALMLVGFGAVGGALRSRRPARTLLGA